MRVAVVGGGIFGTTAAIRIARAGHEVELFERANDLMCAASAINQYRLHRGYHYPRSSETVRSIIEAEVLFKIEYEEAVVTEGTHVYAIASENSLVTADAYLRFCDEHGLNYTQLEAYPYINKAMVDLVIEVEEARYNPQILTRLVKERLKKENVLIHLACNPSSEQLAVFDQVIVATYAGFNSVNLPFPAPAIDLQFELCEKPVVRMPASFPQHSVVIMDGPFMCIDPYGGSDLFVLGNVVHAIHASNVGAHPEIPSTHLPYVNQGIIRNPIATKTPLFIESGKTFIPSLRDAEHVGSLFTIRTVLPRLEVSDARPTIVERVNDHCVRIFSGKVANCVQAAEQALALLNTPVYLPKALATRS